MELLGRQRRNRRKLALGMPIGRVGMAIFHKIILIDTNAPCPWLQNAHTMKCLTHRGKQQGKNKSNCKNSATRKQSTLVVAGNNFTAAWAKICAVYVAVESFHFVWSGISMAPNFGVFIALDILTSETKHHKTTPTMRQHSATTWKEKSKRDLRHARYI